MIIFDLIIINCIVVTCNSNNDNYEDGCIGIIGDTITYVGNKLENISDYTASRVIDLNGKIVTPGFIDAHFHTAQQLMRGLVNSSTHFTEPVWKNYLIPFESTLSYEDVYASALLAYVNLLKNGTTCFADAGGPHATAMGFAALETGIRGFVSYSMIDSDQELGHAIASNMTDTIDSAMKKTSELCDEFDGPLVKGYSSLRQIITCSKDLIIEMHRFAVDNKLKLHTHLSEGHYEVDYALEKFGRRSVHYLSDLGVLDEHLHCAHSVLLTPNEIKFFSESGASVVHCPFNNYSIGFPNILYMQEMGITVSLGTDGVFSAGNIDMLRVAQAFVIGQAAINNVTYNRYPYNFSSILKMMTIEGAHALGIDNDVGSIEVGKKADLISIDISDSTFWPASTNFYSIFGSAVGMNVSTVIINGKLIILNHDFVASDLYVKITKHKDLINEIGGRVFTL